MRESRQPEIRLRSQARDVAFQPYRAYSIEQTSRHVSHFLRMLASLANIFRLFLLQAVLISLLGESGIRSPDQRDIGRRIMHNGGFIIKHSFTVFGVEVSATSTESVYTVIS